MELADPSLPYFVNANLQAGDRVYSCGNEKQTALLNEHRVLGQAYAEVNMIESTHFYMNYPGFAEEYRREYCTVAGIPWSECHNFTEADMVDRVWGGVQIANNTKYRAQCHCEPSDEPLPVCSDPKPGFCAVGCEAGSCCMKWTFTEVPDPNVPYFFNLGMTQGYTMHTCASEKNKALMNIFRVPDKPYAELSMIQSTHFYMDWPGFADEYRQEYCNMSGIPWSTCYNFTKEQMIDHVWGGVDIASQTKYTAQCTCDPTDMTCGDIKHAYKQQQCCGRPSAPFSILSLPGQPRRLQQEPAEEELLQQIDSKLHQAKSHGGIKAERLAEQIIRTAEKYFQPKRS